MGFWVSRHVRGESFGSAAAFGTFLTLACLTMVLPLRWALRIDHEGITRRRWFAWSDLWTWADFASGRIEKRDSYTLLDPARPWWRRKLCLDFLAGDDIRRAIAHINVHYRLPDPPQLPDELRIKIGLRLSVRFDALGIQLQRAKECREYRWRDVRRVHIVRWDPLPGATSGVSKSSCRTTRSS